MKKIITLCLALSFLFSFNAQAQLPDGTIAPDFTATDINGNEWNLYEILDQGKSVILDVSATWCGPCWSYHTSGELEEVYNMWGPDGTDELMVFMIEGDPDTNVDCLYGQTGCNDTSLGDWVAGTPYPIIDSESIADAYDVGAFPTFFHICPNRIIEVETGSFVFSPEELHDMTTSCPIAVGNNNAKLARLDGLGDCVSGPTVISAVIQNLGSVNIASAEVELWKNGVSQEVVTYNGDLSVFAEGSAEFAPIDLVSSDFVKVVINSVNDTDDEDPSDNSLSSNEIYKYTQGTLGFRMITDKWPSEISWELRDASGAVLESNPALECETEYEVTYDLPEDGACYELVVVDGYGDGILNQAVNAASHSCTEGDPALAIGLIEITNSNGDVLWDDIAYGDGFTLSVINGLPTATVEVAGLENLSLFPNPVSDQLNVQFGLETNSQLNIEVTNVLGETVNTLNTSNYHAGSHTLDINTSNFANGIYFLAIKNGKQVTTKKFMVAK